MVTNRSSRSKHDNPVLDRDFTVSRVRPSRPRYIPRSLIVLVSLVLSIAAVAIGFSVYSYTNRPFDVPDLVGKTRAEAETYLSQHDIELGEVLISPSNAPKGEVVSQDPPGGSKASQGTRVNLYVSAGEGITVVPDVLGKSEQIATGMLFNADIPFEIDREISSKETGTVLSVAPPAGTELTAGQKVTLTIALDPQDSSTLVPFDMSGMKVVLDPDRSTAESVRDIPLEVANRLQGLLEASGATVTLTRTSLAKPEAYTTASVKKVIDSAAPDVVITLTVNKDDTAGLQLSYLAAQPSSKNSGISKALCEKTAANLLELDYPATARAKTEDPLGLADSRVWCTYVLGNARTKTDLERWASEDFVDFTSRSLYTSLGQVFSRPIKQ